MTSKEQRKQWEAEQKSLALLRVEEDDLDWSCHIAAREWYSSNSSIHSSFHSTICLWVATGSLFPSKIEWHLTNGPRSVSCRAIRYSGFFGVRETWVLWVRFLGLLLRWNLRLHRVEAHCWCRCVLLLRWYLCYCHCGGFELSQAEGVGLKDVIPIQ